MHTGRHQWVDPLPGKESAIPSVRKLAHTLRFPLSFELCLPSFPVIVLALASELLVGHALFTRLLVVFGSFERPQALLFLPSIFFPIGMRGRCGSRYNDNCRLVIFDVLGILCAMTVVLIKLVLSIVRRSVFAVFRFILDTVVVLVDNLHLVMFRFCSWFVCFRIVRRLL
jgi:hypothetical protein